jgi:hypothetical protein
LAAPNNCQQTRNSQYQFCNTLFGNQITASQYLANLYTWAIGIAVFGASLMIIYAGYKYTTSGGNPSAIGEAKEIIQNALLGLLLLLLSYTILHFLGINLKNASPSPNNGQPAQQGAGTTTGTGSTTGINPAAGSTGADSTDTGD